MQAEPFNFSDTLLPLKQHCEDLDISPLFVADCGSHAWGFNSPTSDWDVKFVYVHNDKDKYVSLREPMQHTSFKYEACGNQAEFVGYDIKKYLNLLLKGNANGYEMVNSEYFTPLAGDLARGLRSFTLDVLTENLDKLMAHYAGLAYTTKKNSGEPTSKRYFYIVRPLLCVDYMFQENKLPPLDFEKLLNLEAVGDSVPEQVYDAMWKLLKQRRTGQEFNKVTTLDTACVDVWIAERLVYWKDYLAERKEFGILEERPLTNPDNFDDVYRELLNGTFDYTK